jgi:hypothetical protein
MALDIAGKLAGLRAERHDRTKTIAISYWLNRPALMRRGSQNAAANNIQLSPCA